MASNLVSLKNYIQLHKSFDHIVRHFSWLSGTNDAQTILTSAYLRSAEYLWLGLRKELCSLSRFGFKSVSEDSAQYVESKIKYNCQHFPKIKSCVE